MEVRDLPPSGLSQQVSVAGGSLIRVVPGSGPDKAGACQYCQMGAGPASETERRGVREEPASLRQ